MTTETKTETKEKTPWTQVRNLGRGMKEAGRHVWLAGLGAIGTVDQQGRGLFAGLVDRGRRFEDEERPVIEERFRKTGERVDALRHRLEQRFEERVTTTLQRFGLPGRGEVHQLIERIEQLTRKVEGLTGSTKS